MCGISAERPDSLSDLSTAAECRLTSDGRIQVWFGAPSRKKEDFHAEVLRLNLMTFVTRHAWTHRAQAVQPSALTTYVCLLQWTHARSKGGRACSLRCQKGARSAMAREVKEVFKLASSARDVESDLVTLAEYSGQYLAQPG